MQKRKQTEVVRAYQHASTAHYTCTTTGRCNHFYGRGLSPLELNSSLVNVAFDPFDLGAVVRIYS